MVSMSHPQEMDAVLPHAPGFGHGEQQQVELFQRFRHLREEPARFPSRLWRLRVALWGVTRYSSIR